MKNKRLEYGHYGSGKRKNAQIRGIVEKDRTVREGRIVNDKSEKR